MNDYKDQIEPFGHFGFHFQEEFNGTIFRYPLRTKESKISNLIWSPDKVLEQFMAFLDVGIDQLLFLQNVKTVSFFTINGQETIPYGSLTIKIDESIKFGEMKGCLFTSKVMKKDSTPETRKWIKLSKEIKKPKEFEIEEIPYPAKCDVLYCFNGLKKGICYTTLPVVETGFPVHFNGWFELMSNRQSLCVGDDIKGKWNSLLMTVISDIYEKLIIYVNQKQMENFDLFPRLPAVNKEWNIIVHTIYKNLTSHSLIPCLQNSNKKCSISTGYFLKFETGNIVTQKLLKILDELDIPVFNIPDKVIEGFKSIGQKINQISTVSDLEPIFSNKDIHVIEKLSQDSAISFLEVLDSLRSTKHDLEVMLKFLMDYFGSQKLDNSQNNKYNQLVNFVLSHNLKSTELMGLQFLLPCGNLKGEFHSYEKINYILDHDNEDFKLIYGDDSRYCLKTFHQFKEILISQYGMQKNLTPNLFFDKVQSTKPEDLILVLNRNNKKIGNDILNWKCMIQKINKKFIPVLKNIDDFPVPLFKGNDYELPGNIYTNYRLVGSICPIFGYKCEPNVEKLLSLGVSPSIDQLIQQILILSEKNVFDDQTQTWVEEIYHAIETHVFWNSNRPFNSQLEIGNLKLVLIDGKYVEPKKIFNHAENSWKPLMYPIPSYLSKFRKLMSNVFNIRAWKPEDLKNCISNIPYKGISNQEKISIMCSMMDSLQRIKDLKFDKHDELQLPTLNEEFKNIKSIFFVDNPSHYQKLKDVINIDDHFLLHSDFSRFSRILEIGKFSDLISDEYSEVLKFEGQHESLCNRIKNILEDTYDFGIPIIHEMIQNADDSGASNLKIILDKRTCGIDMLLHPDLEPTQGSSLIFVNDKPFTSKDFSNIQKLGVKNKLNEIGVTGQFGIGFNSVYHITDCPMILSGKHLAILDPQQVYIGEIGRMFLINDFLRKNCEDSFTPFNNVAPIDNFNGTIIRLPIRKQESEIWNKIHSVKDITDLFEDLLKDNHLENSILFTKHIKEISLEIVESDGTVTEFAECKKSIDKNIENAVFCLNEVEKSIKTGMNYEGLKTCGYVSIQLKEQNISTSSKYLMSYRIIKNQTSENLLAESKKKENEGRYIPFAVTAVKIKETNEIELVKGLTFNTVPCAPFPQKFHVNSSFCLKKSRKEISVVDGYLQQKHNFQHDWNLFLFSEVITESFVGLLKYLIKKSGSTEIKNYHDIFPTDDKLGPDFMKKIDDEAIFYSKTGMYIKKQDVLVIPSSLLYLQLKKDFWTDGMKICEFSKALTDFMKPKTVDVDIVMKHYKQLFKEREINTISLEDSGVSICQNPTTMEKFWKLISSSNSSFEYLPFLLKSEKEITLFDKSLFYLTSRERNIINLVPALESYVVSDIYRIQVNSDNKMFEFSWEKIINIIADASNMNSTDYEWHMKIWEMLIYKAETSRTFMESFDFLIRKNNILIPVTIKNEKKLINSSDAKSIVFMNNPSKFFMKVNVPFFSLSTSRIKNDINAMVTHCFDEQIDTEIQNDLLKFFFEQKVNLDRIRYLPFFETPSGRRIKLNKYDHSYILVSNETQIDFETSKYTFLKDNWQLSQLFVELKVNRPKNDFEIVCQNINNINYDSKLEWINFMIEKKYFSLTDVNFIDGKKVSEFYENINLFSEILPDEFFIPAPFNKSLYANFFKIIGLKLCNENNLINILTKEYKKLNLNKEKCLKIWDFIGKRHNNVEDFLSIDITPTLILDPIEYPKQYLKPLSSMNPMVHEKYKDICWTTDLFVAKELHTQYSRYIEFRLIDGKPSCNNVLTHLIKLREFNLEPKKLEMISFQIYDYLKENLSKFTPDLKNFSDLSNKKIIYLNGEFYSPQLFIMNSHEFKEFNIKSLPKRYDKYSELFELFGVKQSISIEKCVNILHTEFKKNTRIENVEPIIYLINRISSTSTVDYLLTIDNYLVKSDDIYFNDAPNIAKHLDLKLINILHDRLNNPKFGLKLLSTAVKTRRANKENTITKTDLTKKITDRIKNDSFLKILRSLIQNSRKNSMNTDLKIQKLKQVEICLIPDFGVNYYLDEELISNSEDFNYISFFNFFENQIQLLEKLSEIEIYLGVSEEIQKFFVEVSFIDSGKICKLLSCHNDKIEAEGEVINGSIFQKFQIGSILDEKELNYFTSKFEHSLKIDDLCVVKNQNQYICGKIEKIMGHTYTIDFVDFKEIVGKEDLMVSIYDVSSVEPFEVKSSFSFDKFTRFLECPLSKDIFLHPVVASDGFTYEEEMLQGFYKLHKQNPNNENGGMMKSPLDKNVNLIEENGKFRTVPNRALKSIITEFQK